MSTENPEKVRLTVNTGGGGSLKIMEQGKHGSVIISVKVVEQEKFDKSGQEKRIQFTFRQLTPLKDENGADVLDDNNEPIFPIISAWPRLTAYDPRPDTKSSLSILLNQIFGRSLTPEEATNLDITSMEEIQGWVVVGSSPEGKPRFDSWMPPKKQGQLILPNPASYAFKDEVPARDDDDLEDPFAE
jgi:hypothetical protein